MAGPRWPELGAGPWCLGRDRPPGKDRLSNQHMIPRPCRSLPPASIGPLISALSAALISCLLINEPGPVRLL